MNTRRRPVVAHRRRRAASPTSARPAASPLGAAGPEPLADGHADRGRRPARAPARRPAAGSQAAVAGRRVARPRAPRHRATSPAPTVVVRQADRARRRPPSATRVAAAAWTRPTSTCSTPTTTERLELMATRTRSRPQPRSGSLAAAAFLVPVGHRLRRLLLLPAVPAGLPAASHQQNRTGTAERYVGLGAATATCSTGDEFRDGLRISVTLRALHGAARPGARRPAGRGRPPPARGHQDLPDDLLVDASPPRSRSPRSSSSCWSTRRSATSPTCRSRPRDPDHGAAGRGALVGLAEPGPHLHHRAGRACRRCPTSCMEAATLDGYGPVRRFFRVTLPLLSPDAAVPASWCWSIFAFQAFAQIDILTAGGPAGSTETLVFKIFNSQQPARPGRRRRSWPSACSASPWSSTPRPVPPPRPAGALWRTDARRPPARPSDSPTGHRPAARTVGLVRAADARCRSWSCSRST